MEFPASRDDDGQRVQGLDEAQIHNIGLVVTPTEIFLKHGRQRNTSIGSFGVFNAVALPDGSAEVYLAVTSDKEDEYTLHVGDTFRVSDQIWKLDRVEGLGSRDWTVVLTRVD
ncbi:hypothetical protein GCM10023196_074350 [Actinoallomurus vinaceus]|uniref:Head-to-tail stopper n=1 Tax=Actinoallomurus vinaceus TaxID=1080074 RepID=A0ABP8UL61_9ACTN